MSARARLIDRWSEALWWDYVASGFFLAGHFLVIRFWGIGDWLTWIGVEQRVSVYGTAAGIVSAIGGLSSIAISIYVTAAGVRARAARRHYPHELRRNWKGLLAGTAFICLACLVAQALDGAKDPHGTRFIFEFVIALAVTRFLRLLWLFDAMMKMNDLDSTDPDPEAALVMDPHWRQRRRNSGV